MSLIKIIFIFALIVFFIRLKWNLGLVMLIGALFIGILFSMPAEMIGKSIVAGLTDATTIHLILALAMIMVLENVLRKTENLQKMVDSLKGLIKDHRIVMAIMPAVIGLLPSIGGARFSAPFEVRKSKGINPSRAKKSIINYWFRHPWEFTIPLYVGIILASGISHIPLKSIILAQMPFSLAVIIGGIIFGLRGIKDEAPPAEEIGAKEHLLPFILSILPVIAIFFFVLIIGLDISLSMAIVIVALFIIYKYTLKDMITALKESISINYLLMVIGIMIFKTTLDKSGALPALSETFSSSGLPLSIILFTLPFIVGILTGITVAFVGVTFPLIYLMLQENGFSIGLMAFAFAGGYIGVLLSPVHMCLVLTKEYFKAEWTGIYKLIAIPSLIILITAVVRLWIW